MMVVIEVVDEVVVAALVEMKKTLVVLPMEMKERVEVRVLVKRSEEKKKENEM